MVLADIRLNLYSIAYVGQTQNPWVVSDKQAVEVMQKIWNATCSYEYKINIHTQVYQKVRDWFGSRTILIYSIYFRLINAAWICGDLSLGAPVSMCL